MTVENHQNNRERVQVLAWSLVDEQATDADVAELEQLITEDEQARRVYVECMQLHADLHYFFKESRDNESGTVATPPGIAVEGAFPDVHNLGDTPMPQ